MSNFNLFLSINLKIKKDKLLNMDYSYNVFFVNFGYFIFGKLYKSDYKFFCFMNKVNIFLSISLGELFVVVVVVDCMEVISVFKYFLRVIGIRFFRYNENWIKIGC